MHSEVGSPHTGVRSRLALSCARVSRARGGETGVTLGLKTPKDLSFGRRDGFVGRYERANALPPSRLGSDVPFFSWFFPALAAVAPRKGRQLPFSTSRSGLEIAPRSPTPSEAALGRSHVYQRAKHAKGISLAPGIVPKGPSRRARRPAAHRHQTPLGAPKPTSGGFWRGVTRQSRANRVVSRAVPHPYMMHMLGRGQWARQCSMRSVARLSGKYATSIGC